MSELRKCVLIVDDEFLIATLWSILVQNMGLEVCGIAATADEAVALAKEHRPAVVLMDVRLRGVRDGVDAALEIHESLGSKMIFITGSSEPRTRVRIELDHPTATLFKPVSDRQLRGAIEDALQI
jgi:DNA-binding NarL/FixJ family response regulator